MGRTNQIPSYNVNVDVNETGNSPYARENMPRESMPSRLVPSRIQRVGTKRGQPTEKPIENNDAKRVKETEEISNEKEIQNRLPVNPWTSAIICGATASPRAQPRARAPAVN